MSCETLTTSVTGFTVTMASLPEGFCPVNMQELANAIAERLLVSPNQEFNSFAIGSVEPSSNVGPWYKDCALWFTFDDATARYVPIPNGFNNIEYFNTAGAGTFIVPNNIYKLKIHAWGAGGGGSGDDGAASNGSGGGGGAFGLSIVSVTPGQSIPYIIGAGGAGGGVAAAGAAGTSTTILTFTAGGGAGAASYIVSGAGGVPVGFTMGINGQNGFANLGGTSSTVGTPGGNAGGGGGSGGNAMANAGLQATRAGVSPGGGGAGGTGDPASAGGNGADGAILIEY